MAGSEDLLYYEMVRKGPESMKVACLYFHLGQGQRQIVEFDWKYRKPESIDQLTERELVQWVLDIKGHFCNVNAAAGGISSQTREEIKEDVEAKLNRAIRKYKEIAERIKLPYKVERSAEYTKTLAETLGITGSDNPYREMVDARNVIMTGSYWGPFPEEPK